MGFATKLTRKGMITVMIDRDIVVLTMKAEINVISDDTEVTTVIFSLIQG